VGFVLPETSEVFKENGEERGDILCGRFGVPLGNGSALNIWFPGPIRSGYSQSSLQNPHKRTLPEWAGPGV
jgi:hypothetical protein